MEDKVAVAGGEVAVAGKDHAVTAALHQADTLPLLRLANGKACCPAPAATRGAQRGYQSHSSTVSRAGNGDAPAS